MSVRTGITILAIVFGVCCAGNRPQFTSLHSEWSAAPPSYGNGTMAGTSPTTAIEVVDESERVGAVLKPS